MNATSTFFQWLVLPRLQVRSMNAQPAWWCVGAPGPMAACGLAHKLLEGSEDLKGVAMIWHHFELRGEHIRSGPSSTFIDIHPHQHRAAALINDDDYASGSKTLAGQPTVRGDGIVTLILALDGQAGVDLEAIEQQLNSGRLAGGNIVEHQFKVNAARRSPHRHLLHNEWATLTQHVRSGHAFVDRSELIEQAMSNGAKDPLSAFLQCTQRASAPWLTPYLAGYYALTAVQPRRMARDAHPHAFVEPLIGLGQFLSVRGGVIPFWDYATDVDGIYRIRETNCFGGTKPTAKVDLSRANPPSTSPISEPSHVQPHQQ